ncbi:MAG: bifunctional histidinol-phosphatase/imidazoleglycerol-phosphate dehydratase HisB [Calditrichaceae bacterium]|nr:bifunctional histidinol-phosphatase/imidazoleglycerol-phosphate dehydratase HisB [Calditrichaceae bacterium]HES59058.1 bifunctional histidinol-phosphatase/imidazoleglycerol-phosphate dehydratase HisB [Caldithrix sp.]
MKKVLFIDRDGTILQEPEDEQVDSFEKMEFLPGVISNLKKIASELDYDLVMVTNQDGLGTNSFPENTFWPVQNKMLSILSGEGIKFTDILIDRSFPEDNLPTRKPGTGMLKKYMNGKYDLANSYVIGDRKTDVQLAQNLQCKAILISNKKNKEADFTTDSWDEIYNYLKYPPRIQTVERTTKETSIRMEINLDGQGKSKVKSGIGFFDHMLELFAKHSGCDLAVNITGDLHVDEHHMVEDTAIVLGEAINKALGDKRGIERYGFVLPMDESLALVALDFSGRGEFVWKAKFKREKVGEMPTELFYHFFKSFSDNARCNLHIRVKGKNEHHKIEAIFKAFARAIKMAVRRDPKSDQIPSSKDVI